MLTQTANDNLDFLRETFEKPAPTINSLIGEYLEYAENVRGMSESTLKQRSVYLKQFHNYLLANNIVSLATLTNTDLNTFFVDMSKSISVHTGRQIKTATVNTSKRSVKGFLVWCVDYPEIPIKVKLKEIRDRKPDDEHPKLLSHYQIKEAIRRTRNKQDKLMISVMYEGGLRISEAANMKIEHLRGHTLDVIGKGRKHRITFITPGLGKELRAWMKENGWENGYVFRPQMHGDGVGGYTHTDTVRARIKRIFLDTIEVEMHPHLLRHAFALRLLKRKCGIRSIQKLLGHSNIQTTMIYLGIDDDYLESEYTTAFGISVYA